MLIMVKPSPTCQNAGVEGSRPRWVSRMHRTFLRPSGTSWWGERPTWIRHLVYWTIALGVISISAFDRTTGDFSAHSDDVAALAWFGGVGGIVAIYGLMVLLMETERLGAARAISRSLVLFTFALGYLAAVLFYARRWGVRVEACRTVGELETCSGQASARRMLGLLAWHAANVVPVLDITDSLEWQRPARSDHAAVGAAILLIRLWVAIGILAVLKRLWDKWGPGSSSTTDVEPDPGQIEPPKEKASKDDALPE